MNLEIKKDLAGNWFKILQDAICDDISKLEKNKFKFKSTAWKRSNEKDEGGGEYRILNNGKVFEKVGVNFSEVYGKFPKKFQKNIPGAQKDPRFWASGISVVMHMKNPLIPAMHFNTRYICTTQDWFGGGVDVTPTKKDQRIILMTTKASISYSEFKFKKDDTILFGRESAGVPEAVHKLIKDRLKIPMKNDKRSLNIASSVAIVLAESLRQIKLN